jgi:hypothetical protein
MEVLLDHSGRWWRRAVVAVAAPQNRWWRSLAWTALVGMPTR